MKRSGGTRKFRTLGSRMRAFGRSLMRHYVPPQDMPSLDAPSPGWQSAAETPLLWSAAPTPDFGAPADEAEIFDVPAEHAPKTAPRPRPARPAPAAPPSTQAPVQRKSAPPNSKVNPVLFDMLAKHDAREAERQRIREEKKSAFDAAEIQRQADPDAPPIRRRGRMSVDYVETSSLAQGDDTPPRPAKPATPPDATEAADVDTIQPERDTPAVQRQPVSDDGNVADDYTFDDRDDYPDSPQDWNDNDGGDDRSRPPRIDPAPTPPSAPGIAQRAADDGGTFEVSYDDHIEADSDYGDPNTFQDVSAAPIVNTRRPAQSIQRGYQPDLPEVDDDNAAYFTADDEAVPDYTDEPAVPDVSDPTQSPPVQREYQPAAPDVPAETTYFEQPGVEDAAAYDLPAFDGDDGDTRPMPVQRAPVLPAPTFSDESLYDETTDDTGYDNLSDWVDAHSDTAVNTAPETVQRNYQAPVATNPETIDFAAPADDGAGDAAGFDGDDGDTRPIAAQRVYQPPAPEFEDAAAFEPAGDTADEPDYSETSEWGGDVITRSQPNTVQRPTAPEADTGETVAVEDQGKFADDVSAPTYDVDEADDGDFDAPEQRLDAPISTPPRSVQRREADYSQTVAADDSDEFEEAAEDDAPVYDNNDEVDYGEFNAAETRIDSPIAAPPNIVQRQFNAPEATYDETFEVEADGDYEAEAVESDAPVYDDRDEAEDSREFVDEAVESDAPVYDDGDETDNSNFSTAEAGVDAPIAALPNPVQRQPAAPEASRDQTAEVEAGGEFADEPADDDTPLYDSSYEAEYVDFIPAARNLDGTFSTSEPDIAQRTDQPSDADTGRRAAPTPFYGDDVYETDISALLGGQPDPRPIQRRAELPPPEVAADADSSIESGYDAGNPSVDLYQAMMGAGMIAPDEADVPDFGFDNRADVPSQSVQRAPNEPASGQPLDLFQAMMETGMVQPARDEVADNDYAPDIDYPIEVDEPMSAALKADLLSFLDAPAAPRPTVNQPPSGENTISRVYEPPPPPEVVQRVETDEPAQEPEKGADVNVDQLARDVYSKLRSRLRIERERRDHKP